MATAHHQAPHLRVVRGETVEDDRLLGQFIPIHYHYQMLTDPARMVGFEQAIAHVVPEGGRVVELGGGTGVLSFFAARRAARVYCVERLTENAEAARHFLALNGVGDRVEVVQADANDYLPPAPVDVVICEMLHAALIREKQLPLLAAFKLRYLERFGPPLPRFIPEAAVLGVQLVEQSYDFHGFHAPVPLFARSDDGRTRALSRAVPYSIFAYDQPYSGRFTWDGVLSVEHAGAVNAARFVTCNLLAILMPEGRTIDWRMQDLVVPLARSITVTPGQGVRVRFDYDGGDSLDRLMGSLHADAGPERSG